MTSVALLTKDELKKASREAKERLVKEKKRELRTQRGIQRLFEIVNTTLRFPLFAGVRALEIAERAPARLRDDLMKLPTGFRGIVLAPNAHKDELGGHVLEFDHDTRGVKAASILSAKHAFGVTAIFALQENVAGTLSNLRAQYAEALKASIARFPRDAPPISSVLPASRDDVHDTQRWPAFLPVHSRVGLYRRDRTIFLFVKTNAGPQVNEAIDAILAEDGMSIGAFATTDIRVHRIKEFVVRNAERLAARIASDLGFSVPLRDDIYTRLSDDLSYYELAKPVFVIRHNHIRVNAETRAVHVYIDAACSSAILYGENEYAVWCGRTRDYVVAVRPNDGDARVLPLKTDKLLDAERTPVPEEEHEIVGAHVQYLTPRASHVGAFVKYRAHVTSPLGSYKHVSSVHV